MSSVVVSTNVQPIEPNSNNLRSRLLKDCLTLSIIGQVERISGIFVTFAMRWWLPVGDLGIYTGLRILLDNANKSSLGVALGAIQKSVILKASQQDQHAAYLIHVASTTNLLTSVVYGTAIFFWGLWFSGHHNLKWFVGLMIVGILCLVKRRQDFQIAVLRSRSQFASVGRISLVQNFCFGVIAAVGIITAGFWGLMFALSISFVIQGFLLDSNQNDLKFPICWDLSTSINLALTGLPIFAANSAWALLNSLDKATILTHMNDGTNQVGLYSVAVLATSWTGDIASRVATVFYPEYQKAIGQGVSQTEVLLKAEKTSLILLGIIICSAVWVYWFGLWFLPLVFPKLSLGLTAFGPMLPGAIALSASWPLRQAWTALGKCWLLTIPAIVAGVAEYVLLVKFASAGTIADIATVASLCQIMAVVSLFGALFYYLPWQRTRTFQWLGLAIWSIYWGIVQILLMNIFSIPSVSSLASKLTCLGLCMVGSGLPILLVYFVWNKKTHHRNNPKGLSSFQE